MRGVDDRVRQVAAVVAARSQEIEAARELPADVVAALIDSGVFELLVPRALGGAEAPIASAIAAIEELAAADGSVGWCAMIGATTALIAGYLPEDVAAEVFAPGGAITCGAFATVGRATPVDGGLRVTGRWPFVSACRHAGWIMAGVLVDREGAAEVRHVLFRARDVEIVDTWDTSGLRGTGSHDVEATDVFVPAERVFSIMDGDHRVPAYRRAIFGTCAAGIAAVGLGIARAAIDAFLTLVGDKRPFGAPHPVVQSERVQLTIARAEASLRAARAFLYEAVTGADGSQPARALVRLAACHAASASAAAVDLVYEAGGASSIFTSHPLQRHWRDVHVITQHAMVGAATATLTGAVLAGVLNDVPSL